MSKVVRGNTRRRLAVSGYRIRTSMIEAHWTNDVFQTGILREARTKFFGVNLSGNQGSRLLKLTPQFARVIGEHTVFERCLIRTVRGREAAFYCCQLNVKLSEDERSRDDP